MLFPENITTTIKRAFEIYHSGLAWKTKYGMIFSEDVSKLLLDYFPTNDYYDPDMNYDDDVIAFMNWLEIILGDELKTIMES